MAVTDQLLSIPLVRLEQILKAHQSAEVDESELGNHIITLKDLEDTIEYKHKHNLE